MQRTVKIKDVAMACFDFFVSIFDFMIFHLCCFLDTGMIGQPKRLQNSYFFQLFN